MKNIDILCILLDTCEFYFKCTYNQDKQISIQSVYSVWLLNKSVVWLLFYHEKKFFHKESSLEFEVKAFFFIVRDGHKTSV